MHRVTGSSAPRLRVEPRGPWEFDQLEGVRAVRGPGRPGTMRCQPGYGPRCGSRAVKVIPASGVDTTDIVPPCASTICAQM